MSIKPRRLRSLFSEFGAVESVRLRSVPVDAEGKMPRGGKVITGKLVPDRNSTNAYVVFKSADAVPKATLAMNMKEVDGRHVRVDAAAAPSSHANEAAAAAAGGAGNKGGDVAYDHTRSVFLGNLPYAVDEEEVIRLFHRNKEYPELSGAVEAVRVVRDRKTNLGKGIAFVLFRKTGDARTALLLDGSKMGDREIRVTRASKNRAAATKEAEKKRKARDDGRPKGAARRLGLVGSDADGPGGWEGSRSRPGGKRQKTAFQGGAPGPGGGRGGSGSGGRGGGGGRGGRGGRGGKPAAAKRDGKRPAVAARKAKAKAKAAGEKARGK